MSMTVEELLEKIEEFAALEDGWDSYGARPITKQAIDAAKLAAVSMSPTPDWIVPTSKGGIQFEWYLSSVEMELEFYPNGSPAIFVVPKLNGAMQWHESIEVSPEANSPKEPAQPGDTKR